MCPYTVLFPYYELWYNDLLLIKILLQYSSHYQIGVIVWIEQSGGILILFLYLNGIMVWGCTVAWDWYLSLSDRGKCFSVRKGWFSDIMCSFFSWPYKSNSKCRDYEFLIVKVPLVRCYFYILLALSLSSYDNIVSSVFYVQWSVKPNVIAYFKDKLIQCF